MAITKEQREKVAKVWEGFHREEERIVNAYAEGTITLAQMEADQAANQHERDENLSKVVAGEE